MADRAVHVGERLGTIPGPSTRRGEGRSLGELCLQPQGARAALRGQARQTTQTTSLYWGEGDVFVSRLRAVTAHRILFRDWEPFGLGMHARKARQQVPSLDESGRIRAGSALPGSQGPGPHPGPVRAVICVYRRSCAGHGSSYHDTHLAAFVLRVRVAFSFALS